MRSCRIQFAAWLALTGVILGAWPACASQRRWPRMTTVAQRQRQLKPRPNANPGVVKPPEGQGNARGMMGLPPRWVERLRNMSPDEQERFMRNNARFQALPAERQEQIRENVRRWNSLTPEQRNELLDREQVWERMTPEQRQFVRTELLPRWQALPQARKQALRDRMRELRGLNETDRQARLNDEAFLRGLDADERDLLRHLSELRISSAP